MARAEHLDYPFRIDGRGRAGVTGEPDHVRDLVIQLLLTEPGERVMQPRLGCGLRAMVFDPNSEALAAATQTLVQGALQHWLGDRITLEAVRVEAREERLEVNVAYVLRETGERRVDTVAAPAGGGAP
jgi:hypothetical protein